VGTNGCIKWRNRSITLSTNIIGDYVGIAEQAGNLFSVHYGNLQLGSIEAESGDFKPEVRWTESD
jgi:hypothetical protein